MVVGAHGQGRPMVLGVEVASVGQRMRIVLIRWCLSANHCLPDNRLSWWIINRYALRHPHSVNLTFISKRVEGCGGY